MTQPDASAEPTTIGLSERAHTVLKRLKDEGHFAEMVDAYRLGISLAIAYGVVPPEIQTPRTTIFSVATVDPDREIGAAIRALTDLEGTPVYRMAERLAEWGINELGRLAEAGEISVPSLLSRTVSAS